AGHLSRQGRARRYRGAGRWDVALGYSLGGQWSGRGVTAYSRAEKPDRGEEFCRCRGAGLLGHSSAIARRRSLEMARRPGASAAAGRVAAGCSFDIARGGRRMNFMQTILDWLGRLLGLDKMQSVADFKFSFAASWAQRAPMLLLFGISGLVAVAAVFYFRHQSNRHRRWRVLLFLMRAAVLCQVLVLLAEPILTLTIQSRKRPSLWLLFDGTDSMNIADDLPPDLRAATDKAVGIDDAASSSKSPGEQGGPNTGQRPSRIECLRALVQKKDENLLELLSKEFRLQ